MSFSISTFLGTNWKEFRNFIIVHWIVIVTVHQGVPRDHEDPLFVAPASIYKLGTQKLCRIPFPGIDYISPPLLAPSGLRAVLAK